MVGELGTYKPFDYPSLCDLCGNRRRISAMVKKPGGVWVCDIHKNERTKVELDRLNAKQRPYNIIPVPHPKPGSLNPDVMSAEEAVIINFVGRMVDAGERFESVASGQPAPVPDATFNRFLNGYGWAAHYLYTVIQSTAARRVITRAKELLASIATQVMGRQQGFGISTSSTKTNDAFFGGFKNANDTQWFTENVAMCGLALLYSYRVTGNISHLVSARAAASFLRNVQAIGSDGTNFTSSDSGGTARLYTGALSGTISQVSGFYSNHLFDPTCLTALMFWKALQTTDGDQQIGSDGTPTGFDTVPQQLLSTSISELRAFWTNGVLDAAGETYTGLSTTTPREKFNAYPASKPNFASVTGTGRWEYQDGNASVGTLVTMLNWAKGLHALHAYEGASSQVTTIDDWLVTFTSNTTYETPDNTSAYTLARTETGDFDATLCPSSLLLVRDSNLSATKQNGSSLYDWGAWGLLSPIWSSRHAGTFADARRSIAGKRERYSDGSISDGDYVDLISLRGQSGLSYQTSFTTSGLFLNELARSTMIGIALHQSPLSQVVPS